MTRDSIDYDHEYPPAKWTADGIADAFRTVPETFPVPRYEETARWEDIRRDSRTKPVIDDVLDRAGSIVDEPVPQLPASAYLEYERSGSRPDWEDPAERRLENLKTLTMAECLERDGTYLDSILDYVWDICNQATWVMPALLPAEHAIDGLPADVPVEQREIGLHSTMIGRTIAEILYMLDDRLHPAVTERAITELEERILRPYESRDDIWWLKPHTMPNQNAVNHYGVVTTAMYIIDDPERQARILSKAVRYLKHYLDGFDEVGATNEGVGYWNYGFTHYVKLAAQLEVRTEGQYSLLSPPIIEEIADYPRRVELSPRRFPAFADAREEQHVNPAAACWLGKRLDLPGLAARGRREFEHSHPAGIRNLVWVRDVPDDWVVGSPPKRQFFSGTEWWLARANPARTDGLTVAAKGGHNGESHNHNDCGSFVVHCRGESLITDIGLTTYHSGLKESTTRYNYLHTRSLGHPVPYVNGTEQQAGREYAASIVDRTESADVETIAIDLCGCYPDHAGIESLVRTITLERDGGEHGRVVVDDAVSFAPNAPNRDFESILTSFFPMENTPSGLRVHGENGEAEISLEPGGSIAIEHKEDALEIAGHYTKEEEYRDVWRARIEPESGGTPDELSLTMTIEP